MKNPQSSGLWPVKDSILERAGKPDKLKTSQFDWAASAMVLGHQNNNFPASWSQEPWNSNPGLSPQ
jgi:hypothetical protein